MRVITQHGVSIRLAAFACEKLVHVVIFIMPRVPLLRTLVLFVVRQMVTTVRHARHVFGPFSWWVANLSTHRTLRTSRASRALTSQGSPPSVWFDLRRAREALEAEMGPRCTNRFRSCWR